ncbi:MAG: ABC transporter permease [Chelatococcus sp.]|nr:ABC transporter permease [Chelatococcus sp. YT9]MBX3556179.1 ABC transporter permease [Chelatococcus sp.]
MAHVSVSASQAAGAPSQIRRWLRQRGLLIGAAILTLAIVMALGASWLAPADPYLQNLAERLLPPVWDAQGSWEHILGTDQLGRDYLSRIIYGVRVSLMIAFGTAIISGIIGTTLGALAGYFGGRVDLVISFIITVRLAMPVVLVALAVVGLVGNSLPTVILVLGFLLWDRFAVVTRSTVMQIRNLEYIAAAKSIGCTTPRILLSSVLPNAVNAIVVVTTLEMAHAVLLEAALSFLGLGVQPPVPSWGLMISEGKDYVFFTPWVIAIPGIALLILVLGMNFLGDGLRDVLSPSSRDD